MTEPFLTTVVGSMPKPAWLFEPSLFHSETKDHHGSGSDWRFEGDLLRDAQDDATWAVIHTQERAGIDIVSDGEMRRKSIAPRSTNWRWSLKPLSSIPRCCRIVRPRRSCLGVLITARKS